VNSPYHPAKYERPANFSATEIRRQQYGFGFIKAPPPASSLLSPENPSRESNGSDTRTPIQTPSEEQNFITPTKITREEVCKMIATAEKRPSTLTLLSRANKTYGLNTIIQQLAQLLPLHIFAHGLTATSTDRESKFSTISAYVEHLQRHRPQLITDILAISTSVGKPCHDFVEKAHSTISGQASDTLECVIFAITLYVLGKHEASSRKSMVLAAVQDFVIGNEEQREALFEASKQGKLLNLPLPVSNTSDLWHLPGYVSLHPELNLAGFEFAWQTLFLLTMNVLAFEECSKVNIGALETALRMFETSGNSTSPHPLRQRDCESTTNWAARVTVHLRWTKAACIEAGCPERCPNDIQLKLLTFHCISDPILEVAVKIMSDEDLELTTFQATIELMHRAERRLNKQDPQLTTILAMRTRLQPPLPGVAAPQRVSPSAASAPRAPVADSAPSDVADLIELDECPEFLLLAEKLADAGFPCETIVMNGHNYYTLPSDFPRPSKELRDRLKIAKRCNNCADCNPLIPTHGWNQCPYAPHPGRKNFVYPDWHSPMVITPPTWKESVGTRMVSPSTTLRTFPIRLDAEPESPRVHPPFNDFYPGRTSKVNAGVPMSTQNSHHIQFQSYLAAAERSNVAYEF